MKPAIESTRDTIELELSTQSMAISAAMVHERLADDRAPQVDLTGLRAQTFFAAISAETRRPSFGDRDREFVKNLLLRAQEAGLFDPSLEHI